MRQDAQAHKRRKHQPFEGGCGMHAGRLHDVLHQQLEIHFDGIALTIEFHDLGARQVNVAAQSEKSFEVANFIEIIQILQQEAG